MRTLITAFIFSAALYTACTDSTARYIDLNTGQEIEIEKDENGRVINSETKEPVRFYVNTSTNDTIDARTGEVVKARIVKNNNGVYVYSSELDDDGDYKVKTSDKGEYKIKDGDYKKKVDDDGSVKIKDGDTKIKIDEDGKRKVKKDD